MTPLVRHAARSVYKFYDIEYHWSKCPRPDLNRHAHKAHQILMVGIVGDDPTSLQANARLRCLPIPPLGHI